jgi:hypothetical protein
MLLLDQVPRPGAGDTVWLAAPPRIASVVTAIPSEANALDVLEKIWLPRIPFGSEVPAVCQLLIWVKVLIGGSFVPG